MRHPWRRFLVLGLLLFAGNGIVASFGDDGGSAWLPPGTPLRDDELLIQIALARGEHRSDPVVRRRLARNMRFASGDTESGEDELVDEAIALGMHTSDRIVRGRLLQRSTLRLRETDVDLEPTSAELEAFMTSNDRWRRPTRVTLTQRHYRDRERALANRPSSADPTPTGDPTGRGDPLPIAARLDAQSERDLQRLLGAEFAAAALAAPVGRWTGPVASAYGDHWIFVHERTGGGPAELASVRAEVRGALLEHRRERALRNAIDGLRRHYGIPAPGAGS